MGRGGAAVGPVFLRQGGRLGVDDLDQQVLGDGVVWLSERRIPLSLFVVACFSWRIRNVLDA